MHKIIVDIPDLQHVIPGVPGEQPGGEHYGEAGVALPWGGGGPGGQGLIPGDKLQGLRKIKCLRTFIQDIDRCCPASDMTGWDDLVRRLLKTPGKIV